jgi:hypothetical protein
MHPLRRALPFALAVGLVAAAPAAAAPHDAHAPVARAAGSDAGPPVYPGLVNTRLVRTQKALDRAVDNADDGNIDKAVSALYTTRLQLKLAWRAARHKIEHSPATPPVIDDKGRIPVRISSKAGRRKRAAAAAIADQYTTAGGVLDMQHTVAQTAIGMIDTAHGKLRDSLSRTIFTALDQRDIAVAYIHSIDTTPPPPPDKRLARASGAPVGGTWATVMPPIADEVGDEIDQIEGVTGLSSTLGIGIKRVLQDAELQAVKTQRTISGYWPALPADD